MTGRTTGHPEIIIKKTLLMAGSSAMKQCLFHHHYLYKSAGFSPEQTVFRLRQFPGRPRPDPYRIYRNGSDGNGHDHGFRSRRHAGLYGNICIQIGIADHHRG